MNKKVELVLNALIDTYLKYNKPISSTTLKEEAELPYSASSIRNYLQNLEKTGLVIKEHFSSGSKPSKKAMLNYWQDVLPTKFKEIDIDTLKNKCYELDIFAFVKVFENQMLNNVYNFKNKFLILEFEKEEIVFKYSENLFLFLNSLKGLYLEDIKHIFKKYKLDNIKKIDNLYDYFTFNQKILYNLCNDFEVERFKDFNLNTSIAPFEKKGVIYKFKANNLEAILVADVYSNFLELISSLQGGENGKKT